MSQPPTRTLLWSERSQIIALKSRRFVRCLGEKSPAAKPKTCVQRHRVGVVDFVAQIQSNRKSQANSFIHHVSFFDALVACTL